MAQGARIGGVEDREPTQAETEGETRPTKVPESRMRASSPDSDSRAAGGSNSRAGGERLPGRPGEPGLPNTGESPISWDLSRRTVSVCAMPGGAPAAGLGVWRPRSMPGGLWPAPSGTPAPPQPQRRACAL